jgi:hypothetical protein
MSKFIQWALVAVTALSSAAAAAPGRLGSVISSFRAGDRWQRDYCISRDNSYVYVIKDYQEGGGSPLIAYTPDGKFAFSSKVAAHHFEADHSVLGDGYMAAIHWYGGFDIYDYSVYSGSIVGSWAPLEKMYAYAFIPGGRYKYVLSGEYAQDYYIYQFTTEGSLVCSFSTGLESGALAATDTFAGRDGEYLIVAKHWNRYVYSTSGSLIASFEHYQSGRSNYGCVCGPGYPANYGTTLWYIQSTSHPYDAYVFQAYLGNGVPVVPASVGKVKALFR